MRRLVILSISTGAALLLTPSALAGSLPSTDIWVFQGGSKTTSVSMTVNVNPSTESFIYVLGGSTDGRCKSKGKKSYGNVDFNVDAHSGLKIPVKPNGTFSSRSIKTLAGRVKIKGTFSGTRLRGTVTARSKDKFYGRCSGRGKFRAKGEPLPGG